MKNIFLIIPIIVLLVSCASFPQHKVSNVVFEDTNKGKVHDIVYFGLNVKGANDRDLIVMYGEIQKRIKAKFDESNKFRNSYLSEHNKGLYFEFSYSVRANTVKAMLTGLVSGASLILFPVYFTEHWFLDALCVNLLPYSPRMR